MNDKDNNIGVIVVWYCTNSLSYLVADTSLSYA